MSNSKESGCSVSFMTIFLVFLVLKLTNTVAWSWVWITAPLWGPFALLLITVMILAVLSVIAEFL